MSIKFWALEDSSAADHAEHVENLLNQGWERVFSVVKHKPEDPTSLVFISYLQRDTAAATLQKNGVHLASLLEVLERRVNQHEERLEVLEETADMDDEQPADRVKIFDVRGTLIDLINPHTSQYIPLGSIYDEVIYSAIADEENEGAK